MIIYRGTTYILPEKRPKRSHSCPSIISAAIFFFRVTPRRLYCIKAIPTVSSGLDHPTKDERPPRTHIRRISGEHPSVSAERNRTSLLCYCGYSPTPRYDAQLSPAMSARSRCGVYVLRMFKDVSTAGRSFTLRPFKYGPRSTIGTI